MRGNCNKVSERQNPMKQIINAYRVTTNEFGLRNSDGTNPPANMVILTDGNGGTYTTNLTQAVCLAGFNEIELTNTADTIVANANYNTLSLANGPGIKIIKDSLDPKKIIFEAKVTSTFTRVGVPSGSTIYADSESANLNIISDYGIKLRASTNSLCIGSNPSFTSVVVGSSAVNASTNLSSLILNQGFGIVLTNPSSDTITISADRINTLNRITLGNNSTFMFPNQLNNLNLITEGSLKAKQTNISTLTLESNAISQISTASGQISSVSTLFINASTGITTTISNNTLVLATNLPQSITTLSTAVGKMTGFSTINFIEGAGIRYSTNTNNLTIQLDKPYFSQVNASGIVPSMSTDSMLHLSTAGGISYGSIGSTLMINTTDFNAIKVNNLSTLSSSINKKTLNFSTFGDISIFPDVTTNTLTFSVTPTGALSYSKISVMDSANLAVSTMISTSLANPNAINFVSVDPLTISTSSSNMVYFGLNTSSLLTLFPKMPNFESLSIGSTVVMTYSNAGPKITVNDVETEILKVSTVGTATSPFISFDYVSSFMNAKGTIVAENFATFSDSSLKKFTQPLVISCEELSKLTPWKFDWLSDGKTDIGFAAEDVEKIAPELVKMNSVGLRMVDYSRLSVIAISAIKEMNLRVKQLEEKMHLLMKNNN